MNTRGYTKFLHNLTGCKDRSERFLAKAQYLNILKSMGMFQNNVSNFHVKGVRVKETLALLM